MGLPLAFIGNASDQTLAQLKLVVDVLLDDIEQIARERRMARGALPIVRLANFHIVADVNSIHVVYTNTGAGGLPAVNITDLTTRGLMAPLEGSDAILIVQNELGYRDCQALSVSRIFEGKSRDELPAALRSEAEGYVAAILIRDQQQAEEQAAQVLLTPPNGITLQHLIPGIKAAIADQLFNQSVFVMMRYMDSEHYQAIESAIVEELRAYGLVGRLAKDKAYSDDLWDNVCIYMHACKYGIAVFEEIDKREFNPNVAMELGYMYGWGRRVLLLKDQRMPAMPTDVVGRIYRPFDTYKIETSVKAQIRNWAERDLGLSRQE
jgi:hypothetical protein